MLLDGCENVSQTININPVEFCQQNQGCLRCFFVVVVVAFKMASLLSLCKMKQTDIWPGHFFF